MLLYDDFKSLVKKTNITLQHSHVMLFLNIFLDSRHMVLQSSMSLKWRVFFQDEERTLRRSPPCRRN